MHAYVHIDLEKRNKFDVNTIKCYFIKYYSDQIRYRFWEDKNVKILDIVILHLMKMSYKMMRLGYKFEAMFLKMDRTGQLNRVN